MTITAMNLPLAHSWLYVNPESIICNLKGPVCQIEGALFTEYGYSEMFISTDAAGPLHGFQIFTQVSHISLEREDNSVGCNLQTHR